MRGGPDLRTLMRAVFLPGLLVPADAVNPDPVDAGADDAPMMDADDLPDPRRACIMGVIDDAIPFAHERLRHGAAGSRVAAFWAMDAARDGSGPDLPAGREMTGARIAGWLRDLDAGRIASEDGIYRRAGLIDMNRATTHSAAFAAGHGAAVALLAAGHDPQAAPGRDRPLIGVSLPPRLLADTTGTLAPGAMIAAVLFVITRARRLCRAVERARGLAPGSVRLPVVLNLSLGLTAGPRDGSGLVERFLDAICDMAAPDLGPVRVVLPAGNHRMGRMRATLRPGTPLDWDLPPDDRTDTPLEIWGPVLARPDAPRMQLCLAGPGLAAMRTSFTDHGQVCRLHDPRGAEIARAYLTLTPQRGPGWRECVTLIVNPTCPAPGGPARVSPGRWQVAVAPGSAAGEYALSLQRDEVLRGFPREARQSRFVDPAYRDLRRDGFPMAFDPPGPPAHVHRADTVNAYATGRATLRAGAVDATFERGMIYNALIGSRACGDVLVRVDPAPFEAGMIVRGRGSGSFGLMSGSSLAAPWAARWLAERMAAGARPADRAAIVAMARSGAEADPVLAGPGPPWAR